MDDKTRDELDDFLRESVRIDPHNINEEFINLPAQYALWNERYRTALERSLLAEAEVKHLQAGRYLVFSAKTMPSGKPATVDWIKAKVDADEDLQEARIEAVHAEVEVARLKGILEAIRTKRDALMSVGATIRQEMQHDPAVRDRARTDRMAREG